MVLLDPIYDAALDALKSQGAVLVPRDAKAALQRTMWADGKLSPDVIGQAAATIAGRAGLAAIAADRPRALLVEEDGVGRHRSVFG